MLTNLNDAAFCGGSFVKGNIRAVVLRFHGLNYSGIKTGLDVDELELANAGGLVVFPYYGPWSWMNRGARKLVNEITSLVYRDYKLDDSTPLVIIGGSMGGHAALNFARYSERAPRAVACNCPVTDPAFHATERPDLPRTFINAYGLDGIGMEEAFAENSPLEQAENMPQVPYFIVHGEEDKAVNKAAHSDKFVRRMREAGHKVEYIEAPGMGHCAWNDFTLFRRFQDFILGSFQS